MRQLPVSQQKHPVKVLQLFFRILSQKEHLGPHHYLGVLVEGELVAKGGGLLSLVNTCGEIGLEYQIYPPSSPII